MREIGGYIELDTYTSPMLHENGIKLNCGRNALAYLIKSKNIKNILMPKFMCDSCNKVLSDNMVSVRFYSIGLDFRPVALARESNEWLYIVNYYGQLSDSYIKTLGDKVIVDNAQAYFNNPIEGMDTIYSCRKFFGVADGAILYTDTLLDENLQQDESFERMHFLLGRFERSASEFYSEYVNNNRFFEDEPIKKMSKLTENLLHGIDYDRVKEVRTKNFGYLHSCFASVNRLNLTIPEGAFMYPLYVDNGNEVRKRLRAHDIYIPVLWPAVFGLFRETDSEYDMAKNILPLPVDQRYSISDMDYLIERINIRC